MRKRIFLLLIVAAGILALARTIGAAEGTLRDKFHAVQVDRFEVAEGAKFPADYLLTLQEEIIKQLQKSKSFDEVLRPGEIPAKPSTAVLRLTGTITRFEPGSRGKRYIGLGMGQTKIFARLAFVDRATDQPLAMDQVQAILMGGFMGGESLKVTREFGRKVATTAKVILEKRLPTPGESAAMPPMTAGPSAKAERHVINLSSKDFEGSEKGLNEEAAKGFRLVEFAVTSKNSAELTMEKTEAAAPPCEYRILHTRMQGHLQKDLNQAGTEGFRLSPHSLAMFGGVIAVVVEKAAPPEKSLRQYRVHFTMRVSTLQHHVQKDQAEGYVLASTWEMPSYGHLAILEKTAEKSSD